MTNSLYDADDIKPGYRGKGTIVYEPLSALSLTQRLGRLRFACYQLTASIIVGLVIALLMLLSRGVLPEVAGLLGSALIALMFAVYLIGLMVRRLHDMGHSGWWVLAGLLPVANLILMLVLYLGAGSSMVNRFGTPNPPPGALVIVAGGLYWTFNVLGLLASAVLLFLAWQSPEQLQGIMKIIPQDIPVTRW